VGVLIFVLYLYDGTSATGDAELVLIYGMATLSYPAGQLVALGLGLVIGLSEALNGSVSIPTNRFILILE
jgi:hypothetical protein